jgi:hypothetical protein
VGTVGTEVTVGTAGTVGTEVTVGTAPTRFVCLVLLFVVWMLDRELRAHSIYINIGTFQEFGVVFEDDCFHVVFVFIFCLLFR